MDKQSFIHVMHHFSGSSVQEAQDVLSLKENYPYSQLLHALSARVAKDHGFSTHGGELQLAAVYAADRSVLKDIMQREYNPDVDVALPTATTVTIQQPVASVVTAPRETSLSVSSSPVLMSPPVGDDGSPDLAEEVLHDLERLNELKHNFEMMFIEHAETVSEAISSGNSAREVEIEKKDHIKSKKERIVELAKALEVSRAETPEESSEAPKTRKRKKHDGEELIEEIVSSKQQLEPESEKQKEQIEIIDQFIKTAPSISNSKDKPLMPPIGDLAASKTGEFGDNIVSETLVEILVKQGKKDRAIEVLKKLIWKFPQKKAYFAAQIEDLKK